MNRLRILFELSIADFRERTRRYSFLVTMIGVMFFGYLVITGQYTIEFGEYKSVYNAAWAGSLMAVCSTIMMAIIGFYLIRGSIKRDRVTEVGQIIATTQMSGGVYIASKLVSNIATLWLIVTSLAMLAFITLLIRNEAGGVNLWAFASPFFIISLPASIFVASVAVFFDTARWLRGSAGNIIYLFLAESCVLFGMLAVPFLDLASVAVFTDSARSAAKTAFPGEKIGLVTGFVGFDSEMHFEAYKTFLWTGIDWTTGMLLLRLHWITMAFVVSGMAVLLFDRFDLAKNKYKRMRSIAKETTSGEVKETFHADTEPAYDSLCPPEPRFKLIRMVNVELRLALKGYHWFWYAVAVGLIVAQCAAPFDIARMYLVPASMVWPLVIWSSMGTRESRYGTVQLLFSSPSPVRRQFPAIWISGLLIAAASVAGMILRAGIEGEWLYVATLMVAAFLIPTVSLAMGTLSGSKKLFEVTYLMIWYVGSIDRQTTLDLLGTSDESVSIMKLAVLILTAVGSLIIAFISRYRQVRYC
ncbi:MAG: hypothetical protein E4G91_02730 [Candidatus Zixiibacteriota bacterium]|nr:MAG: hypothetical protein E4G91_02730 [candidate division Zixibacteria bacterium]